MTMDDDRWIQEIREKMTALVPVRPICGKCEAEVMKDIVDLPERTRPIIAQDALDFKSELVSLLNRYSRENVSNTPDFILRDFMWDSLKAFERGVQCREEVNG